MVTVGSGDGALRWVWLRDGVQEVGAPPEVDGRGGCCATGHGGGFNRTLRERRGGTTERGRWGSRIPVLKVLSQAYLDVAVPGLGRAGSCRAVQPARQGSAGDSGSPSCPIPKVLRAQEGGTGFLSPSCSCGRCVTGTGAASSDNHGSCCTRLVPPGWDPLWGGSGLSQDASEPPTIFPGDGGPCAAAVPRLCSFPRLFFASVLKPS